MHIMSNSTGECFLFKAEICFGKMFERKKVIGKCHEIHKYNGKHVFSVLTNFLTFMQHIILNCLSLEKGVFHLKK